MTVTSEQLTHQALARAALVGVIRQGQPPNGVAAADCGAWSHVIEAIYQAHAAGGTQAARAAFTAAANADRGVAALLAEDVAELTNNVDNVDNVEPWEPPIPLTNTRTLPSFPIAAFPSWLAEFVAAEAEASQVPVDLPAMLALAVLATTSQGRVRVRVNAGWTEPVNLFALISLPPGNRKSAVFASLVAPLEDFERAEAERLAPEIAQAVSERKILEARLAGAEKIAASAKKSDDADAAREEARTLAVDLAAHVIPAHPRLIADDVTLEMLASMIAEQSGRMAVMSAEGGIFDILSGRYNQGTPNFECFLKGHAGDTLRVDRRSRASEYVPSPALTVGLCVQPGVLAGLVLRPGFRGRGLLGRFLYAVPESLLGHRRVDAPPVPEHIRALYTRRVIELLNITPATDAQGRPVAHTLSLSPSAAERIRAFAEALEPRLGPGGDLDDVTDWAGKLTGAVVRIAGLLHMAAAGPAGVGQHISSSTVDDATCIGAYLEAHARAAFTQMGADERIAAAQHVWRWIERSGGDTFKRRDLFNSVRGREGFKTADALDAPLALLVDAGYIRPVAQQRGKGRPSAGVFEVNPAAQNTQNTQNAPTSPPFAHIAHFADEDVHDPRAETPAAHHAQNALAGQIFAHSANIANEVTPPASVPVARIIPRTVGVDPSRVQELLDSGYSREEAQRIAVGERDTGDASETQSAAQRMAARFRARLAAKQAERFA